MSSRTKSAIAIKQSEISMCHRGLPALTANKINAKFHLSEILHYICKN